VLDEAGKALSSYGEHLVALELYALSIPAFTEAAQFFDRTSDSAQGANALRSRGVSCGQMGNYGLALSSLDRAASLYLQAKQGAWYAYTLREKALVYEKMGELALAAQLVEDALKRLQDPATTVELGRQRQLEWVSGCFETKATILKRQGRTDEAAQAMEATAVSLESLPDTFSRTIARLRRAEEARLEGNPGRAESLYLGTRAAAVETRDASLEIYCLRELGGLWLERGSPEQARPYLREALSRDRALSARDFEALDLAGIAQCDESVGKDQEALRHYDEAQRLWSEVQRGNTAVGAAVSIAEPPDALFAGPLRILLRQGPKRAKEAFERLQTAKSGELTWITSGDWRMGALTPVQREELASLQVRLSTARQHVQSPSAEGDGLEHQDGSDGSSSTEVERATSDLEGFWRTIWHERGGDNPTPVEPVDSVQLLRALPARSAILDFFDSSQELFAFCLTHAPSTSELDIQARVIKVSARDLEARVGALRDACQRGDNGYHRPAQVLYDMLIRQFAQQLKGKDRLFISSSGPLSGLPFQVLENSSHSLNDEFSIVYLPTVSMLPKAARASGGSGTTRTLRGPALIVANPTVRSDASALSFPGEGQLRPLPWADREAAFVAQHLGGAPRVLSGPAATESTVTDLARDARVIHVAAHAFLSPASPMYSGIQLATPVAGTQDSDGVLEAWELATMQIDTELLVLSACETGAGQAKLGEGIVGLEWAAFAAGAHSVVLSQWKVDDWATAAFMDIFYANLRAGMHKDKALQEAARSMSKFPGCGHPKYWAGFILAGAW